MYSKFFHKIIELIQAYTSYTGTSCIFYDPKIKAFYSTTLSRKRYYTTVSIMTLFTAYCDIRTCQQYLYVDNTAQFFVCYIISLVLSLEVFSLFYVACHIDDLKLFMNRSLHFANDFHGKLENIYINQAIPSFV
jgi:hypothetical protein